MEISMSALKNSGVISRSLYCKDIVYRKFETNMPRNKTARPQSQFLLSRFCEQLVYILMIGLPILLQENRSTETKARILKLSRGPRIDSKEPILPGCVAWRAGTAALFLLGS
jgi:hypothetical protein